MTSSPSPTTAPQDLTWIAVLLGAAAVGLGMIYAHDRGMHAPVTPVPAPVRNAGPQEMTMPPRDWDQVDEAGDMSFPASDPPTNY